MVSQGWKTQNDSRTVCTLAEGNIAMANYMLFVPKIIAFAVLLYQL